MTRPRATAAALALLALALAGCGSDADQLQSAKMARAYVGQALPGRKAAPPAPIVVTRAMVDQAGRPVQMITVERTGATGVVWQIAQNRGVGTWASSDRKTVSLRDDVLVATRGLVVDLVAMDGPTAGQIAGGGSWTRVYDTLDGQDQTLRLRAACTAAGAGSERLTIAERSYDTRKVRETCSLQDGSGRTFANEYWFGAGSKIHQSRQWAGPMAGYVAIQRLSG